MIVFIGDFNSKTKMVFSSDVISMKMLSNKIKQYLHAIKQIVAAI